ncbi:MAG: glutamate racemase [Lishizhenia sp.]
MNEIRGKIGVFDSGYGGLTILKELIAELPDYDYVYFGDNARAPYGTKSYEIVLQYTMEAIDFLFDKGCELIILACNTASAKALRTIQQTVLPVKYPGKRVLGVIRPSTERVGDLSKTKKIGVLATQGTVDSDSYKIELANLNKEVEVFQLACPLWVPLIENNKWNNPNGKLLIKEDIDALLKLNKDIDTIILACTHFPLIMDYLVTIIPPHINILGQGDIVAKSLSSYLSKHTWLDMKLGKEKKVTFYTSEQIKVFTEFVDKEFEDLFKEKSVLRYEL